LTNTVNYCNIVYVKERKIWKMKYGVKNLRTNEIEVIYEELERAECYIRISVMFGNERKPLNVKRWTKRDFEIIEVK
jgi:macrodomain Ter protein organizer (MatP/YcbG family)